jgi:hypothetical protein
MNTRLLSRYFVGALLSAGAFGYAAFGGAPGAAAGFELAEQGGGSAGGGQSGALSIASRASRCAVRDPSALEDAMIEQAASVGATDRGEAITIPVYWHVITASARGGKTVGDVSSLVPAQMRVLSDAYAGSRFSFDLKAVEVVQNDTWFYAAIDSPEENAMKAALRRGGPEALNIYTTNGDVYLGWATPAFYYKFSPGYDGVVLWYLSLPGTGLSGTTSEEPDGVLTYDQGDTGTHEVGHWLGLGHTFAGGCSHPGDSIKDTPAEAEPQFLCIARDSCTGPTFPGDDPITNFMDYVDDVCMDHFTSDQTTRMRKHWHAFRDKKTR